MEPKVHYLKENIKIRNNNMITEKQQKLYNLAKAEMLLEKEGVLEKSQKDKIKAEKDKVNKLKD